MKFCCYAIVSLFLCSFSKCLVEKERETVMVRMDHEQLVDTFKSLISSEYLRELANDFATRAATHFINVMKSKQKKNTIQRSPDKSITTTSSTTTTKSPPKDFVLNLREFYTLLQDPAPDGDNLDGEENLSRQESDDDNRNDLKGSIQKINGIYFKRFFSPRMSINVDP